MSSETFYQDKKVFKINLDITQRSFSGSSRHHASGRDAEIVAPNSNKSAAATKVPVWIPTSATKRDALTTYTNNNTNTNSSNTSSNYDSRPNHVTNAVLNSTNSSSSSNNNSTSYHYNSSSNHNYHHNHYHNPVRTNTPPSHSSYYQPPSHRAATAAGQHNPNAIDAEDEEVFRKARGILNKLTPEKFDKLSFDFCSLSIRSPKVLKGVILLILEKALNEPGYSALYAQLCQRLDKCVANFEPYQPPIQPAAVGGQSSSTPPPSQITTFRKLLLTICQHEFDNRANYDQSSTSKILSNSTPSSSATATTTNGNGLEEAMEREERELAKQLAKKKMLGNVKFIGELGKLDLLSEAILHKCIKTLLEKRKDEKYADMCDDLECLCKMMPTIGRKLDQGEAIKLMDQYFERMRKLRSLPTSSSQKDGLPSRIKFLMQDCIELRSNGWQPRQSQLDSAPKTINELRNGEEPKAAQSGVAASAALATTPFMLKMFQQLNDQPNMSLLHAIGDLTLQTKKRQLLEQQLIGQSQQQLAYGDPDELDDDDDRPDDRDDDAVSDRDSDLKHSLEVDEKKDKISAMTKEPEKESNNMQKLIPNQGNSTSATTTAVIINQNTNLMRPSPTSTPPQQHPQQAQTPPPQQQQYNITNNRIQPQYQQQQTSTSYYRPPQVRNNYNGTSTTNSTTTTTANNANRTNYYNNTAQNNNNHNSNQNSLDQFEYPTLSGGSKWGSGDSSRGGRGGLSGPGMNRSNRRSDHYSPSYRNASFDQPNGDTSSSTSTVSTPSSTAPSSVSPPLQLNNNTNKSLTVDTGTNLGSGSAMNPSNLIMPRGGGYTSNRYNSRGGSNGGGYPSRYQHQQPRPLGAEDGVLPLNRPVIPIDKLIKHQPGKQPVAGNAKAQISPGSNGVHSTNGGSSAQVILAPMSTVTSTTAFTQSATQPATLKDAQVTSTVVSPAAKKTTNSASHVLSDEQKSTIKKLIDSFLTEISVFDEDEGEEEHQEEKEKREKSIETCEKSLSQSVNAMSLSSEQLSECVHVMIAHALSSTSPHQARELTHIGRLLSRAAPLSGALLNGLSVHTLPALGALESSYLCVKSNLSVLVACALSHQVVAFADLAGQLRHGTHYPLFFLCMQRAARLRSPEWLREQLVGVPLVDMLPQAHAGDERTPKQRLVQCLDDRELTFVCPMLKLEASMFDVVSGPAAGADGIEPSLLAKWIDDNVDADIRASSDFIISLVTCVVKNAAEKTVLSENSTVASTDKVKVNKQKELIQRYTDLLRDYLGSKQRKQNQRKQVDAIYALQTYADSKGFPKYLLPHLFNQMYDLELIEEEAFYVWKDEINENFPNKGQALFHLQKWFNWLQEASEESESESESANSTNNNNKTAQNEEFPPHQHEQQQQQLQPAKN